MIINKDNEQYQIYLINGLLMEEIDNIRKLHRKWYPLDYGNRYYEDLMNGRCSRTGRILYTVLLYCINTKLINNDELNDMNQNEINNKIRNEGKLIGVMTYSFIHVESCSDKHLLHDDNMNKQNKDLYRPYVLYILTLGMRHSFRGYGISSLFLNYIKKIGKKEPRCGAIYLHTITYNESAIKFYKKNNFIILRSENDFYYIKGRSYDSYLFIYYINEGKKPTSQNNIIIIGITSIFSLLKNTFYWFISNNDNNNSINPDIIYNNNNNIENYNIENKDIEEDKKENIKDDIV